MLIGDRHHDIEGAADNGLPTIFVRWGFSWPHEADAAQQAVEDVDELAELLLVGNSGMNEALAALVPSAVVFGTATALADRAGPCGRCAGPAAAPVPARPRRPQRATAGSALVALDDAVAELDLEVGLSGALYGGEDAATLRRARMSAQHARDQAFQEYRDISAPDVPPPVVRRTAERIRDAVAEGARRDRGGTRAPTPSG